MPRLLFLLFVILAACSPRAELLLKPDAAGVGHEVDVYIATTRRLLVDQDPGLYRSARTSYLSRRISVPPERSPGTVSFSGPNSTAETDFVVTTEGQFPSADGFRRHLATELANRPAIAREVVVYIHGFNNNFADGVLRIAQLSHDLDFPGVSVHYSWPSAANPLGYSYDRDSVLFARDGLEELLRTVSQAGAERILVVGHSMGALLTMETLRQISIGEPGWPRANLDGVILLSPDIDIEVFQSQVRRIQPLPERFAIFVSDRDRVLRLSARLTGQSSRLGNIADAETLADLDVTLLDVSEFSRGPGHFTTATSPALIALLRRLGEVDRAFQEDTAGRTGLGAGTVLTVQNATNILLGGR
ncbi:MAG: alpha/beta fold hydrolase [Pseudomonadota bacterium]